jgi:hypothetical protein
MHELQRVLERQVRELARRVLGHPQGPELDRSAENGDVRSIVAATRNTDDAIDDDCAIADRVQSDDGGRDVSVWVE